MSDLPNAMFGSGSNMSLEEFAEIEALREEFMRFAITFSPYADHYAIIAHFVRKKVAEALRVAEQIDFGEGG